MSGTYCPKHDQYCLHAGCECAARFRELGARVRALEAQRNEAIVRLGAMSHDLHREQQQREVTRERCLFIIDGLEDELKAAKDSLGVALLNLERINGIYTVAKADNRFSWRERDTVIPSILKEALPPLSNSTPEEPDRYRKALEHVQEYVTCIHWEHVEKTDWDFIKAIADQAFSEGKPSEKLDCVCGEWSTDRRVIHRKDGPCYLREPESASGQRIVSELIGELEKRVYRPGYGDSAKNIYCDLCGCNRDFKTGHEAGCIIARAKAALPEPGPQEGT